MYMNMILKTIVLSAFLFLSYRVMGKKELGNLNIIDLMISFLMTGIAAIAIQDKENSLLFGLIPIAILVIIQIVIGYLSLKNHQFRRFMDGNPTVIIEKGKLNFRAMAKLRYSLDDLLTQLREQGIHSIEHVNYAVLENDGKLSIFEETTDYPLPLILDGVIEISTLKAIHKDSTWLFHILKQKGVNLKDVFYAFYTERKIFIIKRSDLT